MITAAEIAAALDEAGLSNLALARTLGCGPGRVRRVRAAAGIPAYQRGRRPRYPSWEAAFAALTVAVEGGHVEWSGAVSESGTPLLRHGSAVQTAYRHAFRVHHGREPEGRLRPWCSHQGCVAGAHLADRIIREQRNAGAGRRDGGR